MLWDATRVLFVHAHPDDETLSTGGTLARLSDSGVEAAVVTATRGEAGEVMPGPLACFEGTAELAELREKELAAALSILGVRRHVFLRSAGARGSSDGPERFRDSGMRWGADGRAEAMGDAGIDAFTMCDPRLAVADLTEFVQDFAADLIISYDRGGGYGHPDHVRARLVAETVAAQQGIRLAEIVPEEVGEAGQTDEARGAENAQALEVATTVATARSVVDASPSDTLWITIDVARKRAALAAYASQLGLTENGYVLSGGQAHTIAPTERFRRVPRPLSWEDALPIASGGCA